MIASADEYERDLASFREEETQVFTLLYPNPVAVSQVFGDRVQLNSADADFTDLIDLSQRFNRFDLVDGRALGLGTFDGGQQSGNVGSLGGFNTGRQGGFGGGLGGLGGDEFKADMQNAVPAFSFPLVGGNGVAFADVDVLPGDREVPPGFRRRNLSRVNQHESIRVGVEQQELPIVGES